MSLISYIKDLFSPSISGDVAVLRKDHATAVKEVVEHVNLVLKNKAGGIIASIPVGRKYGPLKQGATQKLEYHDTNLTIIKFKLPARFEFGPHNHKGETEKEAIISLKGDMKYLIDGKEIEIKEGRQYTINAKENHGFKGDPDKESEGYVIFAPGLANITLIDS
jgi:quercetin dioxygenase-like cupin family protein